MYVMSNDLRLLKKKCHTVRLDSSEMQNSLLLSLVMKNENDVHGNNVCCFYKCYSFWTGKNRVHDNWNHSGLNHAPDSPRDSFVYAHHILWVSHFDQRDPHLAWAMLYMSFFRDIMRGITYLITSEKWNTLHCNGRVRLTFQDLNKHFKEIFYIRKPLSIGKVPTSDTRNYFAK